MLPDGETLELSAQGQLIRDDWRQSTLAVYLKTPSSNLARWVPKGLLQDNQLTTLSVGGALWLRAAQGQMHSAVLRLDNFELEGRAVHAEPLHLKKSANTGFLSTYVWLADGMV